MISGSATRIGFWLQARVAQTAGENWGVVRASTPTGGTSASYIAVIDSAGGASISRGTTNSAGTNFGRGSGYRAGGTATGQSGNAPDSTPFPNYAGNQNGTLDNGGSGVLMTRIYGFDSYVGGGRTPQDPDAPSQPWNVNGAPGAGSPVPSDGTFSPWANLYRVWIDITSTATRDVTVSVSALLNGATQAAPTDGSQQNWVMQVATQYGVVATASYTFHVGIVPTPGAMAVLGLGALTASRRRR
ncbi:MAG: hypothetical protein QM783_00855 [Phycisphaerales bacterium]